MGCPLGFTPEAALEALGLPLWGPGVEVVQLPEAQGFWQHQGLKGVGGQGSRKHSALEGYGNPHWPIRSSILAWRTPLPDREAWQATVHRVAMSRTLQSDPVCIGARLLLPVAALPQWQLSVKVVQMLGLRGALAAPSVQGHGLAPTQELGPYQSLFLSLL